MVKNGEPINALDKLRVNTGVRATHRSGLGGFLPSPFAVLACRDPELLSEVLTVFQSAIAMRLRAKARRRGLRGARHASVTVIQRFGGALNLDVHFHSLVADGVWVMGACRPRFVPLRVDEEDVRWVVGRVWRRSLRLLS